MLLTLALSPVDWAMGLLSLGYGAIVIWRAVLSERSFVTDTSPLSCRLGYGAIFIGLWDYPHLNGGLYCLKEALSLLVLCVCVCVGGGGPLECCWFQCHCMHAEGKEQKMVMIMRSQNSEQFSPAPIIWKVVMYCLKQRLCQ